MDSGFHRKDEGSRRRTALRCGIHGGARVAHTLAPPTVSTSTDRFFSVIPSAAEESETPIPRSPSPSRLTPDTLTTATSHHYHHPRGISSTYPILSHPRTPTNYSPHPMPPHINPNDPNSKKAAAEILRRHDNGEAEANITTAVRNFLTVHRPRETRGDRRGKPARRGLAPRRGPNRPRHVHRVQAKDRHNRRLQPRPQERRPTRRLPGAVAKSRAACAWASSPTASTGCCAGPTPDR